MERSVANLTTEQLYRKRALDRVNQRVSRARKKTRINELEDEVADLKRRLARSEELVKTLQGSEASMRQAIESARTSLRLIDAIVPSQTGGIPTPAPSTIAAASASEGWSPVGNLPSPSLESASKDSALVTTADSIMDGHGSFAMRHEDLGLTVGLPFSADPGSMFSLWDDGFPGAAALSGFSLSLDPFPTETDSTPWVSQEADLHLSTVEGSSEIPIWQRLPLHVEPTCRLDEVILEVVRSGRQREQSNGPIPELSEGAFPSIKSLLNPETQNMTNPISNAVGQHGKITMNIANLPAWVAAMNGLATWLRWLIHPTKQNYEAIPEHKRPLEIQLTVPHPAWVDTWIWPEARENIIKQMDWSEFPILRKLINASISVNWKEDVSAIFTQKSKSELQLSPAFRAHIRKIDNWTLGPEVGERFPFLKDLPLNPPGGPELSQTREEAKHIE
ncbi:hypothetical protein B0J11DRAFT_578414 [Dendryphion nanum]|uniref:BZIP domain-containing protein n=1 Tax=Dendryphion nanum TaxID=256645 RepID=A0A9P9IR47_9PLEO|nr:hypothetical protein B0J11DRAFT_578414 [Dendryphion nanum]